MTKRGERRFRKNERNVKLSYERQGLIWFTARTYKDQPRKTQEIILDACRAAGGELAGALFAYVTTDRSIASIMREHYIASETTIYRMMRDWYMEMDRRMRSGK